MPPFRRRGRFTGPPASGRPSDSLHLLQNALVYAEAMKASEVLVRLVVSPAGAALDRFGVRFTGHSAVSWIFARAEGVEYNAPLLLTTIGRVTGKKRTVVLPHFPAGDALCVIGSRGGAPSDPYWARNLRANSQAWIRVNRKLRCVQAHFAEGTEREVLWASVTQLAPIYLEYKQRAREHREIPVIVLTNE